MGLVDGLLLTLVGLASAVSTVGAIRKAPRLFTTRSILAVRALAGAAALGAVLAPGSPTGLGVWDAVLRAAFAGLVTLAAAKARRWAWIVAAALGALSSGGGGLSWVPLVALVALGLGVGAAVAGGRRNAPGRNGLVLGAVIGGATVEVLLRLPLQTPFGASALIAGAGAAVLAFSGLRQSSRRTRHRVRGPAIGLACVVLGLLALSALAALEARGPAQQGLASANAGLAAARSGAVATSGSDLRSAAGEFTVAERSLGAWWAWPARLVPVAAQNYRAVQVLVAQGAAVAGPAATVAASGHGLGLRSSGGAINLAAFVTLGRKIQASRSSLALAAGALGRVHSPWLVPPLARKIDQLRSKLVGLGAQEAKLGLAARELPGLLGSNGSRRYLLVVQDPVEQRGAGGVIGDYGVLTAEGGRLSLSQFGPTLHLNPEQNPVTLSGPLAGWAKIGGFAPQTYPGDASFAPDFPTDAAALEQIYAQTNGIHVDGVLSVDPLALADLSRVTGPVSVSGWPVPLDATNLAPVLLHDQYTAFAGQARQDFLDQVTQAVFHRLTTTGLASPEALAHALEPAVSTGHLLAYSRRPAEQALFASLGLTGAMAPVNGDFFQLVTQNAGEDKIDWYLRRSVDYQATYDPATGSVSADATITLVNQAPASGQPSYVIGGGPGSPVAPGVNRTYLSLYSPLLFAGGTLDGRPLLMASQLEHGRHVYSQFVSIPPGGTAVLRFHLLGSITGGGTYRLYVAHQPTAFPDQVQVAVHPAAGWAAAHSNVAISSGVAEEIGPASAGREVTVQMGRA